ncbi:MAG: Nif3-like dinuclear metal center hexameric protein [Bacteroidales bacterium]|nr:Nif3-like dinuclear metal center hexameric protein [Bacteroidales bacterium]MDD4669515.1 Nif3-like dinuclear metal center hexameric protein [Bacteroidales bacterium]
MKAKEIASIIEQFAPLQTQEEWDNAGFCIGSPDEEIKGVLIGLDCTPELIKEAVDSGDNMIVTHHPLIFDGIKKIDPNTFLGEAIYLAIKHNIVVYSAHTNADKASGGVNTLMTEKLNLQNVENLDSSGLCRVGYLPQAMTADEFRTFVINRFSLKAVKTSKPVNKLITKVATCCGSGSSFIETARLSGADVYITADISYHHFFCENDFMVMDIGHYESEIDIVNRLLSVLTKKIHTFAVRATRNNNNPIYYY